MADPFAIRTARVDGKFTLGTLDSLDAGLEPDTTPLVNWGIKLTPTPLVNELHLATPPETKILEPILLITDATGAVKNPDTGDLEVRIWADYPVPGGGIQRIMWHSEITPPGSKTPLISKDWYVPTSATAVDLTTVAPIPGTTVINLDQWELLVANARSARDVAVLAAQSADASATDALAARNLVLPARDEVVIARDLTLAARDQAIAIAQDMDHIDAADVIATRLAMESGNLTVAVASDSTANDGNDWIAIWAQLVADRHPDLRVVHTGWDNTVDAWKTPWVIQEGTGTADTGGVAIADTFTRTGELVGSTSDNGKIWDRNPSGPTSGIATGNGGQATFSGVGGIGYTCPSKNITIDTRIRLVTTAVTPAQSMRIYIGGGVWAGVTIATAGWASVSLYKGGTALMTTVQLFETFGVAGNSATPVTLGIRLELDIQNVKLTVTVGATVRTYTATITEADYTALTTVAYVQAQGNIPGIMLDDITISTPVVSGTRRELRIKNGSVGGTTLANPQAKAAAMWPTSDPMDVVIVAAGHNYGATLPPAFLTAVEAFVTAYHLVQPGSRVLVSSQNPQYPPAGGVVTHRARQVAIRTWAKTMGLGYVPAYEAFVALPDKGASMMTVDGVHPSTPPGVGAVDGYGSTLWAKTMDTLIVSRY